MSKNTTADVKNTMAAVKKYNGGRNGKTVADLERSYVFNAVLTKDWTYFTVLFIHNVRVYLNKYFQTG